MNDKALFHWIDYVIFVTSLIIGAAIGIYYGCFNKSQNSVEGLLMGNRKLGVLPVALSIQATFVSAIIILGGPSEVYSYGTMIFMWILSDVISIPLLIFIFVPYFRSNPKTVSVYQYLEERYDRKVRRVVAAAFCFQTLLSTAVALYAPSLAFSQVTGLPMWLSLFATGAVCAFYTALHFGVSILLAFEGIALSATLPRIQ